MKTTPKDFFLHLGVIVTLYTIAVSLINLAFKLIEAVFPNLNSYHDPYSSSISWPVAILIIFFPIFVLLSWLLNRDYKMMPEKRSLGIRKWLIYITLFVAGIVIAGDLVVLIFTFLNGEVLTTGFILKVLTVFIVAGAIFWYYISDLRDKIRGKTNKISASISGIIILILIITGFSIIGSPKTQRMRRYDQQKVFDLQNIQYQLVNYWQQKRTLPMKLENLQDPISGFTVPKDSQTNQSYEYSKKADRTFEICAEFNVKSVGNNQLDRSYPKPAGLGFENENWSHDVGRTCFERTIDPELYPPRKI